MAVLPALADPFVLADASVTVLLLVLLLADA
jgi:hypothetical protein